MKNILILAYDFPPFNSVGSFRPYAWMKYFHEFEVFPYVVCRNWDEIGHQPLLYTKPNNNQKTITEKTAFYSLVKAPYRGNLRDKLIYKYGIRNGTIRKFLSLIYSIAEFHSLKCDARSEIYNEAEQIIANHKIDCIIASGEPFVLFRYANMLSSKYKIPWIADYRDAWTTNFNMYAFNPLERFIKAKIIRKFELKIVKSAYLITTVSEGLVANLKRIHPNRDIRIIMNGYFHEDFESVKQLLPEKEKLIIAYSGSLYPYQRLEVFLEAYFKIIEEGSNISVEIRFYGMKINSVRYKAILDRFPNFEKYCKLYPILPRSELLEKLTGADVLLLLANEKIDGSCAKVFEYMVLQKPILLSVNDHSTLETLLINNKNAYICENVQGIVDALRSLIQKKNQNGYIESHNFDHSLYSRKNQTEKLKALLSDIDQ